MTAPESEGVALIVYVVLLGMLMFAAYGNVLLDDIVVPFIANPTLP